MILGVGTFQIGSHPDVNKHDRSPRERCVWCGVITNREIINSHRNIGFDSTQNVARVDLLFRGARVCCLVLCVQRVYDIEHRVYLPVYIHVACAQARPPLPRRPPRRQRPSPGRRPLAPVEPPRILPPLPPPPPRAAAPCPRSQSPESRSSRPRCDAPVPSMETPPRTVVKR